MIHDSQRCFEILWLNSLLSWAFSGQDKKMKISGIINGSVTFKWYESYLNTSNTELCWILCSFFLYWFFHGWYEITKIYNKVTWVVITYVSELILPPYLHWVHLILNAKTLIQNTFGNAFLAHRGGLVFHIFPRFHSTISCEVPPDTF